MKVKTPAGGVITTWKNPFVPRSRYFRFFPGDPAGFIIKSIMIDYATLAWIDVHLSDGQFTYEYYGVHFPGPSQLQKIGYAQCQRDFSFQPPVSNLLGGEYFNPYVRKNCTNKYPYVP